MAQNVVNYSNNPTGPQLLDDYLAKDQENRLTSNSGIQRPSYAQAGSFWLDTSSTPWVLKFYDGSSDISIGTINASTHSFSVQGVDASSFVKLTGNQTIAGTKTFSTNPVVPTATAGDNSTRAASTAFVTTAVSNGVSSKANDNAVVKLTGNQTISGTKTFSDTLHGGINKGIVFDTTGGTDYYQMRSTGNPSLGVSLMLNNDLEYKALQANSTSVTIGSANILPNSITPNTSDNSTRIATTAFVKAQGYVPSSSFEEVAVVVESYQGTSDWYRVWSDGWIEQGGRATSLTWTFPKPFSSATSFSIVSNNSATTDGYGRPDKLTVTATGATADSNAVTPIQWIASGK